MTNRMKIIFMVGSIVLALFIAIATGVIVSNFVRYDLYGSGLLAGITVFFLSVISFFRLYLLMDMNDNLKKLQNSPGIMIRPRKKEQPSGNGFSDSEKLEKLASFREKGIITEEQYQNEKNRIINDIR